MKNFTLLSPFGRPTFLFTRSGRPGGAVTQRSWETVGLPVRVSVGSVVQSVEQFYGPAEDRQMGLWRGTLRACGFGRTWVSYCPAVLRVWSGFRISVPRYTVFLTWTSSSFEQRSSQHYYEAACSACAASERPRGMWQDMT